MRKKRKKKRSSPTSRYRSGFEQTLANQLKRSGVAFEYETIKLEYRKVATYTPDFILPNGIIIEAKGVWTVEDRAKHLLVREQHPEDRQEEEVALRVTLGHKVLQVVEELLDVPATAARPHLELDVDLATK